MRYKNLEKFIDLIRNNDDIDFHELENELDDLSKMYLKDSQTFRKLLVNLTKGLSTSKKDVIYSLFRVKFEDYLSLIILTDIYNGE